MSYHQGPSLTNLISSGRYRRGLRHVDEEIG